MTDEHSPIAAEWLRVYEQMCSADGADPVEAAEKMLTVACLLIERVHGPRDVAARLAASAGFFIQKAQTVEPTPSGAVH